ncbi:MAG: rRNA cytosine-C5-methylase, partial [Bacteroidales bacterium]|nr:rRNA cytosine-C5-methylase [Bacteroidales bacterium]
MISESFRAYLEEAIGSDNALVAFSAFDSPASVSVRRNPFKNGVCPQGREVPWNRYGMILPQRPNFTLDPHFHAGCYYVQDSSSMFVGYAFRKILEELEKPAFRPLRVLDLCAAPGGKTTDVAASLRECFGDDFVLVANEVMKARAGVLADNVALWGDPDVIVTSDDPKAFASLPGFFDVIIADVPCSGEGMFRKDEEAREQWSVDNVA